VQVTREPEYFAAAAERPWRVGRKWLMMCRRAGIAGLLLAGGCIDCGSC